MTGLDKIFPRIRAQIFRCLFASGEEEFHLRELSRRSGLSIGAIQYEIKNLASLDLVLSRRDGNRKYWRANKAHPFYPELKNLVAKGNGVAESLKEALSGLEGICLAFVYGSMADGTEKATSDLDLMVIGSLGLRPLVRALQGAQEKLGREINPYTLSKADWKNRLAQDDAFIRNVKNSPKQFIKGTEDELERLAK
jgi:predicted nucleotidyltransferase